MEEKVLPLNQGSEDKTIGGTRPSDDTYSKGESMISNFQKKRYRNQNPTLATMEAGLSDKS